LLTDIRHDCVRTSLRSVDDAATGDVQGTIDEPLQATQSRRMKYPAGPPFAVDGAMLPPGSFLLKKGVRLNDSVVRRAWRAHV